MSSTTTVLATQAVLRPVGAEPLRPDLIRPVRNQSWKPSGGLWTSTYDPNLGSAWADWCVSSGYGEGPHALTLLEVDPAARLARIDSHDDLLALYADWSWTSWDEKPRLDYQGLADAGYAGVHLSEQGREALADTDDYMVAADYSVESTVWFTWAFTTIAPGPVMDL